MTTSAVNDVVDRFVAAFNADDLDAVMSFFAKDAEYLPGDGSRHVGKTAIRREFEAQFEGRYGQMRFLEHDRLIDESGRKAAIRWLCQHDLRARRPPQLRWRLGLAALSTALPRFGWKGLDVFHFDDAGLVTGKYTYSNYWLPRISRRLRARNG